MTPAIIHELMDQLLARDRAYRPLELLLLLRRLDREGLARSQRDPGVFLEDQLYGDVEQVIEQLNWAAARARTLGLVPETEARGDTTGALFRRATADHQARTQWHRAEESGQADLFMDNRVSMARSRLVRALESADREAAESALADLSRADPGNELQADAEHLTGALAWLEDDTLAIDAALETLEGDLRGRARRLLGEAGALAWLARFYGHLAALQGRRPEDTHDPEHHPAVLLARAQHWEAVLEALPGAARIRLAPVLIAEIRASLALGQRERALQAMSVLCWTDATAAEAWLEAAEDDELSRRVEQFWDLETPLDVALFPAWLLARGYPVPAVESAPTMDAARALECIRTLRSDPNDLESRQWLQEHSPELMAHWMGQRPVPGTP